MLNRLHLNKKKRCNTASFAIMLLMTAALLLSGCISIVTSSDGGIEPIAAEVAAKGPRPNWLDDKNSLYPDDQYLVEIGIGGSLDDARKNGMAALSQIFSSTVSVDTSLQTRYNELSDGSSATDVSIATRSDQSINQLSNATLVNVNFGESWQNEVGEVYVIAYIERLPTATIYRQRIEADGRQVTHLINSSRQESDVLRSFAYLDAALVIDANIRMLLKQLDILIPSFRNTITLGYDPNQLQSDRLNKAAEMRCGIDISGDSDNRVAAALAQALTGRGFSVSRQNANLNVVGSVGFADVDVANGYVNVRWNLVLELRNQSGQSVVSIDEQKRESALNRPEAINRSYRSIEKAIAENLLGGLNKYLDGFVK